jgi:hypothetical protein
LLPKQANVLGTFPSAGVAASAAAANSVVVRAASDVPPGFLGWFAPDCMGCRLEP